MNQQTILIGRKNITATVKPAQANHTEDNDQDRSYAVTDTSLDSVRQPFEAVVTPSNEVDRVIHPINKSERRLWEALPGWAADFCRVHEEKLEMNADMLAVIMATTVAGFIAGHVVGDAAGADVPAVLQCLITAPPSGGKSRAFQAVTAPLYPMQERAVLEAANEWVNSIRPQIIICQRRIDELKKNVEGKNSDFPVAQEIAELERQIQVLSISPELKKRYLIDNSTGPARNLMIAEADRNAVFLVSPDGRRNLCRMLDGRSADREQEIEPVLKGQNGEPLVVSRVPRKQRNAPNQWLSVLIAVQPDLAEKFWADPLLRRAGIHSRFQGFSFVTSGTTGMRYPDDEVNEQKEVWQGLLTNLEKLKRDHLGGAPVRLPFHKCALERLAEIVYPFATRRGSENELASVLESRWRESVMRLALNLAMMTYDGSTLPEVGPEHIDAACVFVFRAHRDALTLAGDDARSPEDRNCERLMQFLAENGGMMPLESGNSLGLSIAKMERIVKQHPERLRIAPISTGGRGRPKMHIQLLD